MRNQRKWRGCFYDHARGHTPRRFTPCFTKLTIVKLHTLGILLIDSCDIFPATTFGRLLSSNSHNTLTAIGEGVGWGATSTTHSYISL